MAPSLSRAQGRLPTKDYKDKVPRLKAPLALSFWSVSFWGGEVSCFLPPTLLPVRLWLRTAPSSLHAGAEPAREGIEFLPPPPLPSWPSCTLTHRQEGHQHSLGSSQGAARGLGNGRHPGREAIAAGLRQGLLAGLWEQNGGTPSAVSPPCHHHLHGQGDGLLP